MWSSGLWLWVYPQSSDLNIMVRMLRGHWPVGLGWTETFLSPGCGGGSLQPEEFLPQGEFVGGSQGNVKGREE